MSSKEKACALWLKQEAYELYRLVLEATTEAGSGHPTSCLSAADLISALFFHVMRFDAAHKENPCNDRFILSKGHAAPLLYAVWQRLGILSKKELLQLRSFHSPLEGHPTKRFPYAEVATGSLGCGLSIGAGMAFSDCLDSCSFYTYVLLGDSECAEGAIWEAAEVSAFYGLSHLVGIIDCSRLGQSTQTMYGYDAEQYKKKLEAFGWRTCIIDGHNMEEILLAFTWAHRKTHKPSMIIAKTIKGYGVDQAENRLDFHGKVFAKKELPQILQELKKRFFEPKILSSCPQDCKHEKPPLSCASRTDRSSLPVNFPIVSDYKKGDLVATRKAFGNTLIVAGKKASEVVVLDAEVKNSTYTDMFESVFPDRFIQCFIAEQNMIGMAQGLADRGKIPFVATFAAFFSRAFDQLRMTPLSGQALRLAGSHAGVSVGPDGPSQMGLEDIALMRSLPDSIVLYPCDAVSTYYLVEQMTNYSKGISYLRMTRMATPIIYDSDEKFPMGGCKILTQSKQDVACVVGAGITVHEALKAYEQLKKEKIYIAVIDLYSVKPFDQETVYRVAQSCQNCLITVEDHYRAGGIGEMIAGAYSSLSFDIQSLYVNQLPHSGKPEELLAHHHIDSAAIVAKVKESLFSKVI